MVIIDIIVALALSIVAVTWTILASPTIPTAPAALSQRITPLECQEPLGEGYSHLLCKVRPSDGFASNHLQTTIHVWVETLESRLGYVPSNTPKTVYCRSSHRSAAVAQILVKGGYQYRIDLGSIQDCVDLFTIPIPQFYIRFFKPLNWSLTHRLHFQDHPIS
jgi:rhodanese-related sulfurtransferase